MESGGGRGRGAVRRVTLAKQAAHPRSLRRRFSGRKAAAPADERLWHRARCAIIVGPGGAPRLVPVGRAPGGDTTPRLTILGAGIAGLATGFYARRRSVPVTLFEAQPRAGGLSVTYEHEGFLFDSGAHRFHDKDPGTTRDVRGLLGDDLRVVVRPSRIYDEGRLLAFPFRLTDVFWHLGPATLTRGVLELAAVRVAAGRSDGSFAGMATHRYGRTLAERFLLRYSRKLWGLSGDRLSPRVSGNRLRGLDLREFLLQTVLRRKAGRRDVDGTFLYPVRGIGMIADALAASCEPGAVRTSTPVLRVRHDGTRISSLELAGGAERVPVDRVVSTLPIERLLAMLDPPPPGGILGHARSLKHRNLVLVALFLRKPTVTDAATVYFPDPGLPFTRVTEPRNRSDAMSPPGHTSLVAEIPCGPEDPAWSADDAHLVEITMRPLEEMGWLRRGELLSSRVVRVGHAYPVLSLDLESSLGPIRRYLSGFSNLVLAGRNGRFEYSWIHDMVRDGRNAAQGAS
jgi:protoporphyrinogen oxidase